MHWNRLTAVVGVGILALTTGACGNDSDGDGDDSSDVSITSFDVSSDAVCSGGDTGTVQTSWETSGATDVEISVDGDLVASGPDPSGSNVVDVPCDGEDHEVELTAMDGDGKSASKTATVTTEAGGGGPTTTGGSAGTTTTTGGSTTTTGGGTTPTGPSAPTGQVAQ